LPKTDLLLPLRPPPHAAAATAATTNVTSKTGQIAKNCKLSEYDFLEAACPSCHPTEGIKTVSLMTTEWLRKIVY